MSNSTHYSYFTGSLSFLNDICNYADIKNNADLCSRVGGLTEDRLQEMNRTGDISIHDLIVIATSLGITVTAKMENKSSKNVKFERTDISESLIVLRLLALGLSDYEQTTEKQVGLTPKELITAIKSLTLSLNHLKVLTQCLDLSYRMRFHSVLRPVDEDITFDLN